MTNVFNHIVNNNLLNLTKLLLGAILLVTVHTSASAQVQSVQGRFEVAETTGCAPFTISPQLLVTTSAPVAYDYENTSDPTPCLADPNQCAALNYTTSTTFTYNTPGTYYLTQIIGENTGPVVDFIEITVVEAVAPDFQVALCSGNEVSLTFNFGADQYDSYAIDYGDGSPITNFTKDPNGPNVISHNYGTQGMYSINVAGRIAGGNNLNCASAPTQTITTLDNIPGPSITGLTAQSNTALALNYATLDQNINYDLEIDTGNGFGSFTPIDPQINPTTITIDDPSIDNSANIISLRIVASDACNTSQEVSNEVASIAFSTQTLSTTNTINIAYHWATSATDFSTIELIQNGNQQFSSNQNQGNEPVSYTSCTEVTNAFMQKTDANGALVRSLSIAPLENQTLTLPQMATPEAELMGSNVQLTFRQPPFAFSSIRIYRQDSNGDFVQIATSTQLSFTDIGVSGRLTEACYRSDYLDECDNISEQSEEVCVPLAGLLRAPTAFSPNGDGQNDEFTVGSGVFDGFQLTIFNKWGNLVFQSKDINRAWNGDYNGQPAPNGTYTYKVLYMRNGQSVFSTGTVTIIR